MEINYSTSQVAKILAVHPNTVRWYEKIGFISPVSRLPNGYRQFGEKQLVQLKICRLIFNGVYPNKTIREAAFAILHTLKGWDVERSLEHAYKYRRQLEKEYASALETAALLKKWTEHEQNPLKAKKYTRKEAACLLGITTETLRNWERNSLICTDRKGDKNERVFGGYEIRRLRVIYMLRQNNYSIAAIHRSLSHYDRGDGPAAALALNQPLVDPESMYMNAGDHWLEVLAELSGSANKIIQIIAGIEATEATEAT
jgi:DNA-binding transcriptional MerR regulator